MKYTIAILLISLASLCFSESENKISSDPEYFIYTVNTDTLNVREQPNLASKVITTLKNGSLILSTEAIDEYNSILIENKKGNWLHIYKEYPKSFLGYVFSAYLTVPAKIDINKNSMLPSFIKTDSSTFTNDYNEIESKLIDNSLFIRNKNSLHIQVNNTVVEFNNISLPITKFKKYYLLYYDKEAKIAIIKKYWYDSSNFILLSLISGEEIETTSCYYYKPYSNGNIVLINNGDEMNFSTYIMLLSPSLKILKKQEMNIRYQFIKPLQFTNNEISLYCSFFDYPFIFYFPINNLIE